MTNEKNRMNLADLNGALLMWETPDGSKRAVEFEDNRQDDNSRD